MDNTQVNMLLKWKEENQKINDKILTHIKYCRSANTLTSFNEAQISSTMFFYLIIFTYRGRKKNFMEMNKGSEKYHLYKAQGYFKRMSVKIMLLERS